MAALTKEQLAILTCSRSACVQACPGSGKTQTLVEKVAKELLDLPPGPFSIAAITFTNAAADEILHRIEERYPDEAQRLWVGTIHSWCLYWVLGPYGHLVDGYKAGMRVLDDRESGNILKEYFQFRRGEEKTDIARNFLTGMPLDTAISTYKAEQYWSHLRSIGAIDFGELLYLTYTVLRDNPTVARMVSARLPWIMIDEYQDTSRLQFEIMRLVIQSRAESTTRLLLFGDPDQAIYDQGHCPNSPELNDWFGIKPDDTLSLTGNFRSSSRIADFVQPLSVSGMVMQAVGSASDWPSTPELHIGKGISRSLSEVKLDNLGVHLHQFISRQILVHGFSPNEIAILAPQWTLLRGAMAQVVQAQELQQNCTYSIQCVGVSPLPATWSNPLRYLSEFLLTERSPTGVNRRRFLMRKLLKTVDGGTSLSVNEMIRLMNRMVPQANGSLTEYLTVALSQFSTAVPNLQTQGVPVMELIAPFVDAVRERCVRWDIKDSCAVASALFGPGSGVQFDTIHGSKGKQYQVVAVFGVLRDYLPNWRSQRRNPGRAMVEGKKLLYVATTRAKRELMVIAETGRNTQWGDIRPRSPVLSVLEQVRAVSTLK